MDFWKSKRAAKEGTSSVLKTSAEISSEQHLLGSFNHTGTSLEVSGISHDSLPTKRSTKGRCQSTERAKKCTHIFLQQNVQMPFNLQI